MSNAMDQLVQMIHKLMEASAMMGDTGVDTAAAGTTAMPSLWNTLPKIVVVGGQSSGKSSVLESVVGRDFLPRGKGIVTKRPLVLSLRNNPQSKTEWGEFQHDKGRKWTDFNAIRDEIEAETIRHLQELSKKKGRPTDVSVIPISLTVFSPNVPNLTLVDLPGLVQHAMKDQAQSIVQELEDMVLAYIKDENAIVLAVMPAPEDLANSRALQIAKKVDPTLKRTIGVLTKIDLMDEGTDARDLLMNKAYPLQIGWVGVVNRSQKDIETNKSMQEARSKEDQFFKSKKEYRDLENVGTEYLAKKLSDFLVTTIKRKLPSIQSTISQGIRDLQQQLEDLGGANLDMSRGGMMHLILQLCQQFQAEFKNVVESGQGGGERILAVFQEHFPKDINSQPFNELLALESVKQIVDDSDGYQPHLVAPEYGYRRMIERGVTLLDGPSVRAVSQVHTVLREIVRIVSESKELKALQRYPVLKGEIINAANDALEEMRSKSEEMVTTMVKMESCYINADMFRQAVGMDQENGTATAPQNHYQKISVMIKKYLKTVVQQMQYTIPKAVVFHQVKKSQDNLLSSMQRFVASYDENNLIRLLGEDESVMKKRSEVKTRLELMEKAASEVAKVC